MTVAHSELSDLLCSEGSGDGFSHLPHTDGLPAPPAPLTPAALRGVHPCRVICSESPAATSLPCSAPLPAPRSAALSPVLAFPEVPKPRLADGAVAAVGWPSPRDPLPPAICHLPVLHCQGFRGDPKMDLYPSAVSQAGPGAGEALCPREEQCQCPWNWNSL